MSHGKGSKNKHHGAKQNPQPVASPVREEIKPDTHTGETCQKLDAAQPHKKAMTSYERANLVITAVGVVVGIIVLIIYGQQLTQMKRAVDSSERTTRIDQRAWITIAGFRLNDELMAGQPFKLSALLENAGKTPAVKIASKFKVKVDTTPPSPPAWDSDEFKPRPLGILDPRAVGHTADFDYTKESTGVPPGDVNAYRTSPQIRLWVWIRIGYDDVMGLHHWSQRCASHGFNEGLGAFTYCEGNEIDPTEPLGPETKQ